MYGTWKGFVELRNLGIIHATPKMYAAEIFGLLRDGVKGDKVIRLGNIRQSIAFSIAAPIGTYQALKAVLESDGGVATISDDAVLLSVQSELGKNCIYAELSSCASLAAAIILAKEGKGR